MKEKFEPNCDRAWKKRSVSSSVQRSAFSQLAYDAYVVCGKDGGAMRTTKTQQILSAHNLPPI
jgi:hypothetical protein